MPIILPNLWDYKAQILNKDINYPLKTITAPTTGLLQYIPAISKGKTDWPWNEQTDPELYRKNKNWPKLTIVTPSYNQGQFIEQTIRSVLLQNYPNLEYIIIDGGSTDNTRTIIEKYSPWISYWQSEKDRGQGHAINVGFSIAGGNYYAWINSDDYYLKDTFYKVINLFVKQNVSFVYGYAFNFDFYTKKFQLVKVLPVLDYFIRLPGLVQPSCFWNVKIHQPIWEELHCSLDYELWLRMLKGNSRKLLKEPLSVATIHADAKTSNPLMDKHWGSDHALICSAEAHGSVRNWSIMITLNRLYIIANRLLRKRK